MTQQNSGQSLIRALQNESKMQGGDQVGETQESDAITINDYYLTFSVPR